MIAMVTIIPRILGPFLVPVFAPTLRAVLLPSRLLDKEEALGYVLADTFGETISGISTMRAPWTPSALHSRK